ncbi:Hypothetical predicted protein [Pelobates cultripes]|uniref:Uncharacterized protein n=1 Tax=Pelobates cultripes TaxID=61616 RepID=A0AAD1RDV0_PELCU|nr:Hypothetical predicted protein [Pelobates cultripes]
MGGRSLSLNWTPFLPAPQIKQPIYGISRQIATIRPCKHIQSGDTPLNPQMPFQYSPKHLKTKRKTGVYHKPVYRNLEYFLSGDLAGDAVEWWSPHTEPASTSMGRRNQKPPPGNAAEQSDIGAMI